jgi:Zn-dependent protease/CBS domain-containing protein
MRGSWKIARIAGIDIGVHYTWIIAFFLIGASLALGYFPSAWNPTARWAAGFVSALLLFISVLLHEIAHSLVAQARNLPVSSITLFIFGGVSNLTKEPEKPGHEFVMAFVGPATSLVIGGICWAIAAASSGSVALRFNLTGANISFAQAILSYLAYINLALGVFNLLPGFPLDGGRVLRSILWRTSGNLVSATNVAATVGHVFGWGFIAVGVLLFFLNPLNFISAIWIAIIGVFLNNAAESARAEIVVQHQLAGVKVSQVMEPNVETISPGLSVAELVREYFLSRRRRAVPVAVGDRIVGMVSIADVRVLPQNQWEMTPVERIMTKEQICTVKPDDDLNDAMKLIAQRDLNQLPVCSDGKLAGILTRASIINFLQLRHELGMKAPRDAKPS